MISMHFCPKVIWHLSKNVQNIADKSGHWYYIYGERTPRDRFMQMTVPPLWVRLLLHIKSSLHSLTIKYAN